MFSGDSRKTVRLKRPNPLFETWLTEWKEFAESINSDAKMKFEKALESLQKYPLVLSSGKECLILEHFDAALCIKLDRRLAEYNKSGGRENGLETNVFPSKPIDKRSNEHCATLPDKSRKRKTQNLNPSNKPCEKNSPQPKKKAYLPKNRSGPFALLVTLLKNEESNTTKEWMSKGELQRAGQPLCDLSFTRPQAGSFYTAWSSMANLVTKGFVKKQSHPPRFSLTLDGRELANKLISLYPDEVSGFIVQSDDPSHLLTVVSASDILAPGKKNIPKPSPIKKSRKKNANYPSSQESSEQSTQSSEPIESGPEYFTSNTFDIILLVDTAETIGAHKRMEDETFRELTKLMVKFEVRKLNVGDFLWIARHRESGKELTLPYIVERKRLDDLARSIKDGRFHEQKYRLKQCGLDNVIYLVEQMRGDFFGLPLDTLKFAVTRTQVCDKFSIQIKRSHRESMLYLGQMTTTLTKLFEGKTLFCCKKEDLPERQNIEDDIMSLCTFKNFNYNIGKTKNFAVREILQKQLMQLHGVSSDIAWAIVQVYSTPYNLRQAFLTTGEKLLDDLQYGASKRRVSSAISKTLHRFYTLTQFN